MRNTIAGSAVLLAIVFIAVLLHNLPYKTGTCKLGSGIGSSVSRLDPRADLLAEHRFLVGGPIDINTATEDDLVAIPRVGPALAARLIKFRDENGFINNIDILLEVKGVGPRLLETIRAYIKLSDAGSPPISVGHLNGGDATSGDARTDKGQ